MIKKTAIERAVIVPASHFLFVTRRSIFALLAFIASSELPVALGVGSL